MEYLILWLVFAFILAGLGRKRRVGFWGTFIVALALSPLIGLIYVLCSKTLEDVKRDKEFMMHQQKQTDALSNMNNSQQSLADKIAELNTAKENGMITVEEYDRARSRLL